MWTRIGILLATLVLAAASVLGLFSGTHDMFGAVTQAQRLVTAGQLFYGILGVIALAGLLARLAWVPSAVALWGVTVTVVAFFAPLVYGEHATIAAAIVGAVVVAAIAYGVWRGVRRATEEAARERA